MPNGVILVGGPGSGKSSVGRALAGFYGYRYVDREAQLVARYGSRERFLATRDAALVDMHERILEETSDVRTKWVHETTALTERDFVVRLREERAGAIVHLDIGPETAIARVLKRPPGQNLSNEEEAVRRVWQACAATYSSLPFDLVVHAGRRQPEAIAATIHAWMESQNGLRRQQAPR